MEFDETEFSVEVLDQRGAVFNPVTAIHVNEIANRPDFRSMNVAANDAGHPVLATELDQRRLVVGHVFHRRLGLEFDVRGKGPVAEPEYPPDAIDPDIQIQNPLVKRRPHPVEQPIELSHAVELMSVNHQILPPVGRDVNGSFHEPNGAEAEFRELLEEFIVIAGDDRDARLLAMLAKQFLDQDVVFLGPIPFPAQFPAVDEIAHDVEVLALGVAQEGEKFADLGMSGSQVNVRDPNGAIVQSAFL